MKKPIHLYIFVVLSSIASALRIWTVFFSSFDEEKLRELLTPGFQTIEGGLAMMEETITISREQFLFQTDIVNKILVLLMVGLLIATIVFLFKKQHERASYIYIAYLFGTLFFQVYSFIGAKRISQLYTDEVFRQTTDTAVLGSFGMNVLLFVIYFGLTIFFLLRKPKETPSTAINATDI